MLSAQLLLLIIGGVMIKNSTQRWLAANNLTTMDYQLMKRNISSARKSAQAAAGYLTWDARAVLPSLQPDDEQQLRALARGAPGRQQPAIKNADAMMQFMRDGSFSDVQVGGPNGQLLDFANAAQQARIDLPKWPTLNGPPDGNVLRLALESHLLAALRIGAGNELRQAAGRLLISGSEASSAEGADVHRDVCRSQRDLASGMESDSPRCQ